MLRELKQLLISQGPLSVGQIAQTLKRPPETIEALLEHWQQRGFIQEVGGCGSEACGTCETAVNKRFMWRYAAQVVKFY